MDIEDRGERRRYTSRNNEARVTKRFMIYSAWTVVILIAGISRFAKSSGKSSVAAATKAVSLGGAVALTALPIVGESRSGLARVARLDNIHRSFTLT